MKEVILLIQTPDGEKEVKLGQVLTVGRTEASDLALNDNGLSRRHATFERNGDEIWLYDENSTNGTFLNGRQVPPEGLQIRDGDEVVLGDNSVIFVQTRSVQTAEKTPDVASTTPEKPKPKPKKAKAKKQEAQNMTFPIIIGGSLFGIVIGIFGVIFLLNVLSPTTPNVNQQTKVPTPPSEDIPVVVENLNLSDEEFGDLLSEWDVQDNEGLEAKDIDTVKVASTDPKEKVDTSLNVTREFWEQMRAIAMTPRSPSGERPPGLNPPRQLAGDGVVKQKAKLNELMTKLNYQQPMDFADLAKKRVSGEFVEMPMATKTYVLEVGSSATEGEFTGFDFDRGGSVPIESNSPKQQALNDLAKLFKIDLNNGRDRKQSRMRLLRMFNPRAKPILEELAQTYYNKYKRPLRVTSLTRSMDYQIALNKTNANSFKVRGKGALPPHTSGCAFDLARKHMTAEEQNFVMQELARLEDKGVLDALIEYNANACFHVFIYPDGKPPAGF
jgi:pSer/pThr/pTyr-binding forkhead associated (FHA) protein